MKSFRLTDGSLLEMNRFQDQKLIFQKSLERSSKGYCLGRECGHYDTGLLLLLQQRPAQRRTGPFEFLLEYFKALLPFGFYFQTNFVLEKIELKG